jgi:hypothetical protein
VDVSLAAEGRHLQAHKAAKSIPDGDASICSDLDIYFVHMNLFNYLARPLF